MVCAISSIMTGFVILGGISFLEKIPNRFECKSDSLAVIHQRGVNLTQPIASTNPVEGFLKAAKGEQKPVYSQMI